MIVNKRLAGTAAMPPAPRTPAADTAQPAWLWARGLDSPGNAHDDPTLHFTGGSDGSEKCSDHSASAGYQRPSEALRPGLAPGPAFFLVCRWVSGVNDGGGRAEGNRYPSNHVQLDQLN